MRGGREAGEAGKELQTVSLLLLLVVVVVRALGVILRWVGSFDGLLAC